MGLIEIEVEIGLFSSFYFMWWVKTGWDIGRSGIIGNAAAKFVMVLSGAINTGNIGNAVVGSLFCIKIYRVLSEFYVVYGRYSIVSIPQNM